MTKSKNILLLLVLYILLCVFSFYRHYKIEPETFRSEIWADRAGFYIYLPSTFIYNFSCDKFPENIDKRTGDGFYLNKEAYKVQTKYTYGVALMQLPFFLIADGISTLSSNSTRDGFSFFYQKSIIFAAVFYLVIGLYLLFLSLKMHFNYKNSSTILTLVLLFFGTNLYYYSIMEVGMSHVYSFFLFSCILYLQTHKARFNNKYFLISLYSLISWLIILIRPTNIIFVSIILIWDIRSLNQIVYKIKDLVDLKIIFILTISFLVVFSPQFIYWNYAFGQYLTYSYGDEGFTSIFSPHVIEVLFAPANGLFPYSLIFILALFGIGLKLKKRTIPGVYLSIVFILICYLTASWHDWRFGCGNGMRNMAEYYSLFSFPLAFSLNRINLINKRLNKWGIYAILGLLVAISFKVNYHYFGCYFADTWDWLDYLRTLLYPIEI